MLPAVESTRERPRAGRDARQRSSRSRRRSARACSVWSGAQTEPAAAASSPTRVPIVTFVGSAAPAASSGSATASATRQPRLDERPHDRLAKLPQPCCNCQMADTGPETILFDVFLTNQRRKAMIARALEGTGLPPEDYPFYVFVGAEGPWTPTGLAARLGMPLSTVLFRVRRLERRGHAERIAEPGGRPLVPDPPHRRGPAPARRRAPGVPRPRGGGRGRARRRARRAPPRRARRAARRDRRAGP